MQYQQQFVDVLAQLQPHPLMNYMSAVRFLHSRRRRQLPGSMVDRLTVLKPFQAVIPI
jgi:hypothetical protein